MVSTGTKSERGRREIAGLFLRLRSGMVALSHKCRNSRDSRRFQKEMQILQVVERTPAGLRRVKRQYFKIFAPRPLRFCPSGF
jgi:hypothetical protein